MLNFIKSEFFITKISIPFEAPKTHQTQSTNKRNPWESFIPKIVKIAFSNHHTKRSLTKNASETTLLYTNFYEIYFCKRKSDKSLLGWNAMLIWNAQKSSRYNAWCWRKASFADESLWKALCRILWLLIELASALFYFYLWYQTNIWIKYHFINTAVNNLLINLLFKQI